MPKLVLEVDPFDFKHLFHFMPKAQQKLETAAERYRRLKEERLYDVTGPSGMVFKCKRPNLHLFVANGALPNSFIGKVKKAKEAGQPFDSQSLSDRELKEGVVLANKLLSYCVVSPRIVEVPRAGEDELGFHELDLEDYVAIIQWATPGGGKAESLNTFHS